MANLRDLLEDVREELASPAGRGSTMVTRWAAAVTDQLGFAASFAEATTAQSAAVVDALEAMAGRLEAIESRLGMTDGETRDRT